MVALALVVGAVGCSKKSSPTPAPSTSAPSVVPLASAAPRAVLPTPSAVPSASAASSAVDAGPRGELGARLRDYFSHYKEGSDFEFLRTYWASPVEQFITFKNADLAVVIKSAKQFFQGKYRVKYVPDVSAMRVVSEGDLSVVQLPVAMMWGVQPTDDVPSEDGARPDVDLSRTDLDPYMIGLVQHDVVVDVEIAMGPDGRLQRYLETHVHQPLLRTTGQEDCPPKGETVVDLGDIYVTSWSIKGPQQVRRVRAKGEVSWYPDQFSWEVDNPNGGTSAGGATCLEPVPGSKP
jgi:hypothetical protein